MICAACGLNRDPDDLIAYWPVGYPGRVRFVCRVTRPSPVAQESCFRAVVASRLVHEIAVATYAKGGPVPPDAGPWLEEPTKAYVVPAGMVPR